MDFSEKQRIEAGALRACEAGSDLGDKFRVVFRKGRGVEFQKDVALNPLLQLPDGKQNATGLAAADVILSKASTEGFFLLCWLQFCQQERMAGADFIFEKCVGHNGREFGQFQSGGHECRTLAAFGGNLFDRVLRLVQVQERGESACLF